MTKTVDELLSEARALLPYRPSPGEVLAAQANGALLVHTRGDDQRRADGLIPGAVVLARKAAVLQRLGLRNATDLVGGFAALAGGWLAGGAPGRVAAGLCGCGADQGAQLTDPR